MLTPLNVQRFWCRRAEWVNLLNSRNLIPIGINEFADLTSEEFAQLFNGFDSSMVKYDPTLENDFTLFEDMPSEVDWRQKVLT